MNKESIYPLILKVAGLNEDMLLHDAAMKNDLLQAHLIAEKVILKR